VAPAFVEDDADALRLAALQHPLPMEVPVSSRRLVATGMGFSLHAGTAVHGNDRWDEEVVLSGRQCPYAGSPWGRLDGETRLSARAGSASTPRA
jgi:anti-sigma factor RsiW